MSRAITFSTSYVGTTLTAWGSRTTWDSDGGYGMSEEVVLLDGKRRPIHTLVQWKSSATDGGSQTLRRRFRFADVDGEGDRELCVESVTEVGPNRFVLGDATRFRAAKRFVGYDAFSWNASRFVRVESLDSGCPRTGYELFVPLPLTDDVVHRSRGR